MDIQKLETLPPPPGIFGSLKAGFDIVTNRVVLILIPLGLDLFLWFGPRLSVDGLLSPFIVYMFDQIRQNVTGTDLEIVLQRQTVFVEWLRDFNLLSLLSKAQWFPVGISSLSAQSLPVANPLGLENVIAISSIWVLLGAAVVLIPLGWIGGGVFFRQVSVSVQSEGEAGISLLRSIVQTVFLCVLCVVLFMILLIPLSFGIGLLALVNPAVANIAVLVVAFFSFWLIVPLFFTPHGIFIRKQNALYSILSSLRMIRFSLPTSGMFVLSVFILSQGLDILWSAPKSESWLALVGFAGHAFITTAMLAASFVYYRDMSDWLQNVYERFQQIANKPSSMA
ncbi:MAG TPA: hypothetical protein VJ987_10940 [Anaerolineales bacterium]|nr:hypothetical protein [Anaerolineales bacterium]